MKNLPKISEAEYQVMEVIWEIFPISTNEVVEVLSQKTQWSPKTIQTLLKRLTKKGALSYEKKSRSFVYSPNVKKEDYISQESKSFLNRFYNGTLNSMVLNFLEQNKLNEEDIEELREILNNKKNSKEDKI